MTTTTDARAAAYSAFCAAVRVYQACAEIDNAAALTAAIDAAAAHIDAAAKLNAARV